VVVLPLVLVVSHVDQGRREGPGRHVMHLNLPAMSRAASVDRLLRLPHQHTGSEEQEEAGEEHREEDKEVDVRLVLAEVDDAVGCVGRAGHHEVEPRHLQPVSGVGQHQDQSVCDAADHQEHVRVGHRHEGHQPGRSPLSQLIDIISRVG